MRYLQVAITNRQWRALGFRMTMPRSFEGQRRRQSLVGSELRHPLPIQGDWKRTRISNRFFGNPGTIGQPEHWWRGIQCEYSDSA